jgi:hypothetical protein
MKILKINIKSFFLRLAGVLFLLLSLASVTKTLAVTIDPPTTTVYACTTFPTAAFSLGTIKILENGNTDFPASSSGTIILTAPANFQFTTGVGSAVDLRAGGGNITGVSVSVTLTTITITWSSGGGAAKIDSIAINGVQVQGINTFSSGVVVMTGETGSSVSGASGAPYANLSSIQFPASFAGSDQLVCSDTSMMAANPLLSNITGVWSVISGTGTFDNSGSPTSIVRGLSVGINKFRWTISAAGGCSSYSEMVITRETTGFACANKTNQFSAVTNISVGTGTCTVAGTKTAFTLANAAPFNVGDKVLIIQMTMGTSGSVNTTAVEPPTAAVDATFGSVTALGAAGNYEFAVIDTKVGSVVTFVQNLTNTYDFTGKLQLVTVPQYANHTISSAPPTMFVAWNGTTGGVLVFDVAGTLTLNDTLSMDGKGFAGGARSNFGASCNGTTALYTRTTSAAGTGFRGYGIHEFGTSIYGRGAYANGGGSGSGHNAGGGGGSNQCAGGRGGWEFSSCSGYATNIRQGRPGYALGSSATRTFMGGGGGGGNGDNGNGSAGGAGGGIIIISAREIAGTAGVISANGIAGENNGSSQSPISYADGAGGGGGGGSILLNVGFYSIGSLTVRANGGKGGNNGQQSVCHGPGGGGGAGLVWTSGASVSGNVTTSSTGGAAGIGSPQAPADGCYYPYGSEAGGSCTPLSNLLLNQTACCSPANLGPDQPLCGAGTITLNNGTLGAATNKVFTWYKNGIVISGATGATYGATTTGLYTVRVDSIVGGYTFCTSQSSMNITSSMPTPFLGPDQILCNPSYLDLSPANISSFPAGTTWSWTKDGSTITGATTSSLNNVTAAGTYTVTATATGCPPTSDAITVTVAIPTTTGNCISSGPGTMVLSASGGNGGPYNWYSSSSGGSVLPGGSNTSSFTTPSISSTTTYWVEDKATTSAIWGASQSQTVGNPTNGGGAGSGIYAETFNVLQTVTLNAVTINMSSAGSGATITVNVRSGTSNTGPIIATKSITQTTVTNGFYLVTFTTPIVLAPGSYTIDPTGTTVAPGGRTLGTQLTGVSYPYYGSDPALGNMVEFTGTLDPTTGNRTLKWGSFYDFQFSYTKQCARVPVIAEVGGSCALPVDLINFSGRRKQSDVILNWSTVSETNNDYFLVQRSFDGITFENAGKVDGNGNSSSVISYSFIDHNPPFELLYYRLVQIDKDGTGSSYSKTIAVNNLKANTVSIYPNPFENATNVVLRSSYDHKVSLKISDLKGAVFYSADGIDSNGTVVVGHKLPDGVYVLEVKSEAGIQTFRIVKLGK